MSPNAPAVPFRPRRGSPAGAPGQPANSFKAFSKLGNRIGVEDAPPADAAVEAVEVDPAGGRAGGSGTAGSYRPGRVRVKKRTRRAFRRVPLFGVKDPMAIASYRSPGR